MLDDPNLPGDRHGPDNVVASDAQPAADAAPERTDGRPGLRAAGRARQAARGIPAPPGPGMNARGKPRRDRRSGALMLAGVLLILLSAVGIAYPIWWTHRLDAGGARLLKEPLTQAAPGTSPGKAAGSTVPCRPSFPAPKSRSMRLAGMLEIPALGVRAPVLQGLDDAVLNVAVGHDAATPWPGFGEESILEAHDVSYFSGIDRLRRGQEVIWIDACETRIFRVVGLQVSSPGATVDPPSGTPGLALITCSPTDALFWTPYRYLVETALVWTVRSSGAPRAVPSVLTDLTVPAPAALVAEGLTLQNNFPLLGTLSITGSPSAAWKQSPAPLEVERLALEAYFATQKAIAQRELSWWSDISLPGERLPPAWSTAAPIYVTIDVDGSRVDAVTLSSQFVSMQLVVRGQDLLVGSVRPRE